MQWWWLILAVWFGTGLLVPILWLLSKIRPIWFAVPDGTGDNDGSDHTAGPVGDAGRESRATDDKTHLGRSRTRPKRCHAASPGPVFFAVTMSIRAASASKTDPPAGGAAAASVDARDAG
jgi:hypothetical protein